MNQMTKKNILFNNAQTKTTGQDRTLSSILRQRVTLYIWPRSHEATQRQPASRPSWSSCITKVLPSHPIGNDEVRSRWDEQQDQVLVMSIVNYRTQKLTRTNGIFPSVLHLSHLLRAAKKVRGLRGLLTLTGKGRRRIDSNAEMTRK